jgi:hypothetical protein
METVNLKIKLNIDYSSATELYDEIEGHLALCLEEIMQRQPLNVKGLSADFVSYDPTSAIKLERIITPIALTGFLSEKLGNQEVKVERVEVYQSASDYSKNVAVYIFAPNLWAAKYGKDTESQLADALHYFGHETTAKLEDLSITDKTHIFNGLPVSPLIGSIYYDQLSHSMKRWDGTNWIAQH